MLVGTRKGLSVLRGDREGPLEIAARYFEKEPVEYACFDPRSGTYLVAVTHWPEEIAQSFQKARSVLTFITDDVTGEWKEAEGPAFPEDVDEKVVRTWVIQPGEEDGVVWAGVAPAALFRSDDNGRSWTLNRGLWDEPSRSKVAGGRRRSVPALDLSLPKRSETPFGRGFCSGRLAQRRRGSKLESGNRGSTALAGGWYGRRTNPVRT